VHPFCQW